MGRTECVVKNLIVTLIVLILLAVGFYFGLQYVRSQQAQANLWAGAVNIQQAYAPGKAAHVTFIRAFSTPNTSVCFEFSHEDQRADSKRFVRAIYDGQGLHVFRDSQAWGRTCRVYSEDFLDILQVKGGSQ